MILGSKVLLSLPAALKASSPISSSLQTLKSHDLPYSTSQTDCIIPFWICDFLLQTPLILCLYLCLSHCIISTLGFEGGSLGGFLVGFGGQPLRVTI